MSGGAGFLPSTVAEIGVNMEKKHKSSEKSPPLKRDSKGASDQSFAV